MEGARTAAAVARVSRTTVFLGGGTALDLAEALPLALVGIATLRGASSELDESSSISSSLGLSSGTTIPEEHTISLRERTTIGTYEVL